MTTMTSETLLFENDFFMDWIMHQFDILDLCKVIYVNQLKYFLFLKGGL